MYNNSVKPASLYRTPSSFVNLGLAAPLHNSSSSSAFPTGNGLASSDRFCCGSQSPNSQNLPTLGISITILTKNSSETLSATLDALKNFSEVLVLDSGSNDATRAIAEGYSNVRFMSAPFVGFGKMHNLASEMASHDWILSIDSDEVVSPELAEEILKRHLDPNSVYTLNRHNYFQGKWMKWCSGWYPDPVIRLYHRGTTRFTDAFVHEAVISDHLKRIPLNGKLSHTPYRTIESFLDKMQLYSTLFAEQNKGKSSSVGKAVWRGFAAFIKSYIFKRGFLGGKEGLIISLYNAHTTYYKYLKLAFRNIKSD